MSTVYPAVTSTTYEYSYHTSATRSRAYRVAGSMQMLETNGTSRRQAQVVRVRCSCSSLFMPSVAVLASPKLEVSNLQFNSNRHLCLVCHFRTMRPWRNDPTAACITLAFHGPPSIGLIVRRRCVGPASLPVLLCVGEVLFFTVTDGIKGCLIGSLPSAQSISL